MEKACLENIQSYLDSCVTPGYSEPWYTENPDIFRIDPRILRKTLGYSELGNSEPCQTSTMEDCAKVVNSYSCFWKLKLFLQYQLFTVSTF